MENNWRRKILTIWLGQSISLLTSSILQMAIIWHITATTGSAIMLTLSTLSAFLPQAILGTFIGVYIDRYSKKSVIIVADLFLAMTSIVLALFALFGNLPIWLILIILVFRSIGNTFHEPAAQAITPLIVPSEHITQYAGYSQAFDSICMLLSPSISIVLYDLWDMHYIMLLDAVGAVFAVTLLLTVALPKHIPPKNMGKSINILQETKEGLAVMRSIDGIMPLLIIGMVYSMMYSPVGSLYPHMTMVYFGGTTAQSGLVEIIFSCGSLLGALLLGLVGAKLPKRFGLFGSIFAYGLGIFIIGRLAPDKYWVFVGISFLVGISIPFYHGITKAIYQLTIPSEYLGRAFAVAQSSRRLGMPVGLLFGGLFADGVGINILYTIEGICAMLLAIVATQLPAMRKIR